MIGDDRLIEIFGERLDALGPDFARWAREDAAAAEALLVRSPEARRLRAEARRLEGLVAEAAHAETPAGFAFRVMAEVAARRADRLNWLFGSPQRLGLASATFCALALAVGVALGSVSGSAQAGSQDFDLGAAFALSMADGDL